MKPLYTLDGIVQHGQKRGKQLGFPTVNFKTDQKIAEGLYLSQTLYKNKLYNSLTFMGIAKTFDAKDYLAETYILDFDKDIYGESVSVTILKKLRGNIKFPNVDALIEQMKQDEKDARKFFLNNSHN